MDEASAIQLIAMARNIIAERKKDLLTPRSVKVLVDYCKLLMTQRQCYFISVPPDLYWFHATNWLEEVLAIGYIVTNELGQESVTFLSRNLEKLVNQMVAVLCFAASQLDHLGVISNVVDKMVQNLVCVDILVPYFIHVRNHLAVLLLLDSYSDRMSLSVKLCACLFLAKFPAFACKVNKHLGELEKRYPIHIIAIKMNLIMAGVPRLMVMQRASELMDLVQKGLAAAENSAQMLYNAAYVEALMAHKDRSYQLAKRAFEINPCDQRILLLLMKLLRSYSQPTMALKLQKNEKLCYSGRFKGVYIEMMSALCELDQFSNARKVMKRMKEYWPEDHSVMEAIMRMDLCLTVPDETIRCFREWSAFDDRTPAFFFCLAQVFKLIC